MAEGSERQREQFQQIVDDWADLANRLVSRSAALAKRMVRQEPGERSGLDGPLQDLWMTMVDAAGDVAELSYRWVQAVDGLAGFGPRPDSGGTARRPRSGCERVSGGRLSPGRPARPEETNPPKTGQPPRNRERQPRHGRGPGPVTTTREAGPALG